jgi:CheY-like chemotaxis protein
MKTLLDDFNFECDIANNGKIAIEKLKNNSYDMILMDLQMPEMNGFEATEYIRNVMNSDIPIIALTADVTTVDLAKCKTVGMNDYIAKPIDERLLYSKIAGLIEKSGNITKPKKKMNKIPFNENVKCTNLDNLKSRTKSNKELIMQMISLYLEQTPPLIIVMKQSFKEEDWKSLQASVHKMIPSFSIVGISSDYEEMAKKVQEYARNQQNIETTISNKEEITDLVLEIENICLQACEELEEANNIFKNAN